MIRKILAVLMIISLIQLPPMAVSGEWNAKAVGSNSAITIEWESHPLASFYQLRRISPNAEALCNEPFFGTNWVDTDCVAGETNVYKITALNSSLNRIYEYPEVSAKLDESKPTLSKPCNKTLAFTINQKRYTVDGNSAEMSTAPIIKGGRSFLVIRYVVEQIMGTIGWKQSTRKITIFAMGHEIEMWIGKPIAMVDGVERPIDPNNSEIAPFIENGRTLVPLRFPVEALGTGTINWFGDTKTAVLSFPMGCKEAIKGKVIETGQGFFKVASSAGSKRFEIEGTSPFLTGTCVSVSYQESDGKTIIGHMYKIPCDISCDDKKVTGEVKSISVPSIVITDIFGYDKTYTLSDSVMPPLVGQCISGCADGETITNIMIITCPSRVYEGSIEQTDCAKNEIMISSEGRSLKVLLPPSYPCNTLSVGNCCLVEGQAVIDTPSTIKAEKITPVPCGGGKEYALFAQDYCKDNKVLAQDIEGNTYFVEIPPGLVCSSIKPGSYFEVKGTLSDKKIYASTASVPPAPKNENYGYGVLTSINPLKITIPAGSQYLLEKPKYYGGTLTVGLGIEFWGITKGESIKSVKIETTKDFPEKLSGRVIGAVCQEKKIFIINDNGKHQIILPDNISCEDIKNGTCVDLLGEKNDKDEFLVASLEEITCEADCYGDTFEGIITSIDCANGLINILSDDVTIKISLTSEIDCGTLSVGMCVTVCGHIEDGILKPQTFTAGECSEPDCIANIEYGIITSLDCETRDIELATEDGLKNFTVPITTDCSGLSISDCVQFCGVSFKNVEHMKLINCDALGDNISGIVTEIREDGYLVATGEENLILITDVELNVGECIKAIGKLSAPSFIGTIVAKTPCTDSAVIQGEITSIDCWAKTILIKTLSGTEIISVPEDFNCDTWNVGDCVISQEKDGGVVIKDVNCPDYVTDTIQIVVVDNSNEMLSGITLDTKKPVKIRASGNWKAGNLLSIDAHQINSSTYDNPEITSISKNIQTMKSEIWVFESWDKVSRTCYLSDNWGSKQIVISPVIDFSEYTSGSALGLDLIVLEPGLGQGVSIVTDCEQLSTKDFENYRAVGVIFGVDTVDEVILLHTHDGDNIIVSPDDKAVLKTLKTGDCAIAKGELKRENMWLANASIEASDCMGGEIGRQFTGVVVGIDAITGRLQVASDNGEMMYTIWLEAVSQLTGLTLGDCVSVSGILIKKDDESNLLGRTVTRIDCTSESNKPIQIEGKVLQIDEDAGYVRIKSIDKTSWKAFLAKSANLKNVSKGNMVRCSGRLQAKKGVISKAFVTPITPATFYWSVSGEVIATEGKTFVLKDSDDRDWKLTSTEDIPTAGDNVLAIGILPPDGLAELESVSWISTKGWEEPTSEMSGVVFGLSCGMDNLLIRDKFGKMTSVRLPKTGFCGYFTTGECVDMKGRRMANIPGMAKITSVSQSQGNCYERELTGRILARSTVDKIAIILTTDGKRIRLGFETEAKCVRAEVGKHYTVSGRFMPYAPDILKVDSLKGTRGNNFFSAEGLVVGLSEENEVFLATGSGRNVRVKFPNGTVIFPALKGKRLQVTGSIDLDALVIANEVSMIADKRVAVELVGNIIKVGNNYAILEEEESGKTWRIEIEGGEIVRGEVFVAGWLEAERTNIITGARMITLDNEPTTQILMWGVVKSTDCENNIVNILLDDSSVYEVHSGYFGQCETFTPGEMVQVVGLIQPRSGKVIAGARILRPGLIGDRKVIVGVVVEISCTSRTIKLQEDNRGDIPGNLWTIQLDEGVDCNEIELGERIKVEGDPVFTKKYFLESATINSLSQKTCDVTVQGRLVTLDCEENMFILKSEGRYYKIIPSDPEACGGMIFVGDELKVSATITSNRKTILQNATWKVIPDTEAYTIIHGWVDVASCPKIRFYSDSKEYWSINIAESEPCDRLTKGSKISLKGIKDRSQDHLMHHALIYNYMKKVVFIGVIDEINCATGHVTVDKNGAKLTVNLETFYDDCLEDRFSKGDTVEVTGWQNDLYLSSPVYFANLESFGNEAGLVAVDFIAEVLINPDCGKNEVQVGSSHIVWRVRLPDNFDCKNLRQGDWVRITGGIESWNEKIILSERVEKNKAQIFGSVARANYSKDLLYIQEMVSDIQWTVMLADTSKTSKFKTGDYLIVDGDNTSGRSIIGGVGRKLTKVEGVITGFDLVDQAVLIDGIDYKKYKVEAKTDWINIGDLKVNRGVYAVGTKTGKKEKDGTIIFEECFIELDMGFDPKGTGNPYTQNNWHNDIYSSYEMY
jgi:Copper amine oxidase N-terminal domain/Domain of unknown function (DUF5666)